MPAYGYIRVSRMDEDQPKQSPEVQRERVAALAAAKGDADILFAQPDLDVSGGKTMDERPGFAGIVAAVEDGTCTAVYAYDLSRLFRNLKEQIAFFEMTTERSIPVRLVEGDLGEVSGATGKLMLTVLGAMNQWQREVTAEKIKASLARRERETGERNGNRPYGSKPGEDLEAVLKAFDTAQSFDGAARILNEQGTTARGTKRRVSVWHGSTVSGILRRERPDQFRVRQPRGVAAGAGDFMLSRLLVCGACGTVMTPSRDSRTKEVRYYCRNQRVDKRTHGRGWVSEKLLERPVREEGLKAALISKRRSVGTEADDKKRRVLEAKRERIIDTYADGHIDKAERDRRLGQVADDEAKLTNRRVFVSPITPLILAPATDLDKGEESGGSIPPRAANDYLRKIFDRIVVESMADRARRGPSKQPIRLTFEWKPGLKTA